MRFFATAGAWVCISATGSTIMQVIHTYTHTLRTVLRPFFPDHLGEPMPEENFWTLWCKGRLKPWFYVKIKLF